MSNPCQVQSPDTTNICTPGSIGDISNQHLVPGFCTIHSSGGDQNRAQYCEMIGDSEWGNPINGSLGSCCYDNTTKVNQRTCGICGGVLGVQGSTLTCQRLSYKGDPQTCCFRDLAVNNENEYCFESNQLQRTCEPQLRNITNSVPPQGQDASQSCQGLLFDFCTGEGIDDNTWFTDGRWAALDLVPPGTESCVYALKRNLFGNLWNDSAVNFFTGNTTEDGPVPPNLFDSAEGLQWSKLLMNEVFNKYTSEGYRIGALPGFPGYHPFQNTLFEICQKVPGICELPLENICANESIESLKTQPQMVPWCGCYLPDDEYSTYVDQYQINKQCTPVCARGGNIGLVQADGIHPLTCDETLCIIDNVNIDLTNTTLSGDINFNQFCGACNGGSCTCIISDVNIDTANSEIGGGINLQNNCGTTQCVRTNPDPGGSPGTLPVPCDAPNNFNPFIGQNGAVSNTSFGRFLFILLIIVGILIIILIILSFTSGPNEDKIVRKNNTHLEYELQRMFR
jgi:hypothetical protein